MPAIDEKTFKKHIKEKNFSRVYFLYGQDEYLKRHYAKLLCEAAVSDEFREMNFIKFDGKETKIEGIIDAVEALPFAAQKRCVLVVDLDANSLSQNEMKALKELLSDPPESCVLVFWANTVEVDARRSAKWKAMLSAVRAVGSTVDFEHRDKGALVSLLRQWAARRNCSLSAENARYLIEICSNEISLLRSELDKLCAFTGKGEITRDIIDKVSIRTLSASVFQLSKALVSRDSEKAYKLLGDLFEQREEPVSILSVLSSAFVDMYRAKVAENSGVAVSEIINDFGYRGKEFRIKNAQRDCAGVSLFTLRKALDILAKADMELKSTPTDNRIVLEKALAEILLLSSKEKAH